MPPHRPQLAANALSRNKFHCPEHPNHDDPQGTVLGVARKRHMKPAIDQWTDLASRLGARIASARRLWPVCDDCASARWRGIGPGLLRGHLRGRRETVDARVRSRPTRPDQSIFKISSRPRLKLDAHVRIIYWSDMGTRRILPMRPIHRRSRFVPGLSGLFLL